jgi:hypothetical protein
MAEAMSRLSNPRRPTMDSKPKKEEKAPEGVDEGEASGDPMHDAAEKMHKAEPGSKHMIASHDGYGLKTHSIDEKGEHEGPHEDEEAHAHMQRFMGGEQEQPQHASGMEPEENQSLY